VECVGSPVAADVVSVAAVAADSVAAAGAAAEEAAADANNFP